MKRSRLNPVSKKQMVQNLKRKLFVKDILEEREMCEANLPFICTYYPTDVHEILTRGRGGDILSRENVLALCRMCHTFITDNPGFAQEHGFIISWSVATSADLIAAERARMLYGAQD